MREREHTIDVRTNIDSMGQMVSLCIIREGERIIRSAMGLFQNPNVIAFRFLYLRLHVLAQSKILHIPVEQKMLGLLNNSGSI